MKIVKVTAWIVAVLMLVLLLIIGAIQIPSIQNSIKNQALEFLESKLGTRVDLDRIEISFPKKIVLQGLYLESQNQDTLLYTKYLGVDISMFKLLSNTVQVNDIELQGFKTSLHRDAQGTFNFDYIIEAFASEQTSDDSQSNWKIDLGRIALQDIQIGFSDQFQGHNLGMHLKSFETRIKEFDLENQVYDIGRVRLDGLAVDYQKSQGSDTVVSVVESVIVAEETSFLMPEVSIGSVLFSDLDVTYQDDVSKMFADLKLQKFEALFDHIDLKNNEVYLDQLALENTQVVAQIFTENPSEQNIQPLDSVQSIDSFPWKIRLKELRVQALDVAFDQSNAPKVKQGLDFNHLDFSNLNLALNDFQFTPNFISGNLKQLALKEQSGLEVNQLKAYFLYGEQQAFVKGLHLKTPHTEIQSQGVLNYQSQDQLVKDLGKASMSISVDESYIGLADVLLLMPELQSQPAIANFKNAAIHADLLAEGLLGDFTLKKAKISGLGTTRATVLGRVKGMPDFDKAFFDLNTIELRSSASDLKALLPVGVLPSTVELPKTAHVTGNFKGTLNQFETRLKVGTSSGEASLVASLDQRYKSKEKYRVDAVVQELDLGYILKNDSIGPVSLTVNVSGESFEPQYMNTNLTGHLDSAMFNGYQYKDLLLDAVIDQGAYTASAFMNDPNIVLDIKASGVVQQQSISLKMLADLQRIDLQGLHLQNKPLSFSGVIKTDLNNILPDDLDGQVDLVDFYIADQQQAYLLDTISLKALSKENYKQLVLNSQLVDAIVQGDYKLSTLPEALSKSFATYFSFDTSAEKQSVSDVSLEVQELNQHKTVQKVNFVVIVKENTIVNKLVPDLKELKPIYVDGNYNSASDYFQIHAELASVEYGANALRDIVFDLEPDGAKLDYFLDVARFENENLAIDKMALFGTIGDDLVTYDFDLKDAQDKVRYEISGSLESFDDFMEVKLEPKGFMLNYDVWTVNPQNVLRFGEKGIYADLFEMTYNESLISIQSQDQGFEAPLKVNFTNFDIETLTQMVKQDSTLVSGMIDGELMLKDLAHDMYFESDLLVKDLTVFNTALGNLTAAVYNDSLDRLQTDIILHGADNRLGLFGSVALDTKTLDLELVVDKLDMRTLESFSMGNLQQSTGFLSGRIALGGAFTGPSVQGDLLFNEVGFNVKALNASFVDINETVKFTNNGVEFSKFSIADIDKNVLIIDGQILTQSYRDFNFNLDIKSQDFKAVNSKAKDNELYYGDLLIDTDLKIRGDLNKPVVSGSIGIDKSSDFTFVMPQEDPSIADREGIVEFVDQRNLALEQTIQLQEDFNNSQIKGLDVSIAIQIDKEAQFTIVIDQSNGDKITIKGEGDLMGGIDPSGKTTLTGRYEFDQGAYSMSFNFLKRKFEVQKGSSIVFTGEPTDATLDLTAIYQVDAAPIDLLQNQLADLSPMQSNMYKQKIPFQTLLIMKGELMKPEISFDIQMPEGNTGVSSEVVSNTKTKLEQIRQQESELNKQVFALLLMNRFVGENPFESMAGAMSAESIARQSVSRILSDQLNNLASNLIAGVELDFNLDSTEDYSTGEKQNRTDLNIGVSKRLLNDRLKVTIGSSFGIEGTERENEQSTNIAGDISAEYMLSKDGRYMLRAYRKDEYQVALQGQVVETGVGFVITMSYEKFREIFERRREKRELREIIKQEKIN